MTSVHNEPHPLAHRYVQPSNEAIAKKFGIVRVEDWDDRVAGSLWNERGNQGGHKDVERYVEDMISFNAPLQERNEVVRCHTQSTGELVLLHDAWLKDSLIIA